jgi:hypothetical protein
VDRTWCTGGQNRVYRWTEHGVQVDSTGYKWTEQGVQVDSAGYTCGQHRVCKWTEHGIQVDRAGCTGVKNRCRGGQSRV